jgi:hypothetical protein
MEINYSGLNKIKRRRGERAKGECIKISPGSVNEQILRSVFSTLVGVGKLRRK